MKIQFLGQGYEPVSENAVGNQLINLLLEKDFHSCTIISAFISQAGVNGLGAYIKQAKENSKNITIITGVDQKGTSKEALEALFKLDINSYVFYQPSVTIFHPKIYLFEGIERSVLIIGSSNLTAQGLFSNVEASLQVQINNKNENVIITQLKDYYKGLFDLTDPNLKKLTEELIESLTKAKVIPTEKERKEERSKNKEREVVNEETKRIIYKIFPKRAIATIPKFFRKIWKNSIKQPQKKDFSIPPQGNEAVSLLWESNKLTKRDLNIPTGKNTNPTGSMLFKKGKQKNIDQRHFFREEVFQFLDWKNDLRSNLSHLERATAIFKIVVEGINKGDFELKLTHNTKKDTKTYKQKNSMTSISWGTAKQFIAKEQLIGRTVKLYKDDNNRFILVFG